MKIRNGITLWLLVGFLLVLTVFAFLAFSISEYFKETVLQRTTFNHSNLVKNQISQLHLTPNDFLAKNINDKNALFSELENSIDSPELMSMKVWSTDGTLIYSDDTDIVGKSFHDNKKLNTALQGQTISGISDLTDSDDDAERVNHQLMEMYIPIKSSSGQTYGVIELYLATDLINVYISNTNWMIFVITIIGTVIFGIILFLTFIAFRKNVIIPITTIHEHAKKIEAGDFNVKTKPRGYNELKVLGAEIETMANKLKEQQNTIAKTERVYAIGELAARLAHDLRNPLSVIRNSLYLIRQKYAEKPEIVSSFDRIDRSVFRMTHQIDNVMDFVNTKSLIFEIMSITRLFSAAIEKLDVPETLKINLPQNDVMIMCDPNSMEVVFENLLLNAKQAMKSKGVIDVKIVEEGNLVQIHIVDSGPGIPKEVLPRIFEPLFTTKQEGTGLGLASCKSIIEKHGGTIQVETEVGKGATFIIKIPKIKFEAKSVSLDKNDQLTIQQTKEKKGFK